MDRRLSRDELDELLPVYAVGALEGDELEQVERYLEHDADARAEVESMREAAGYLTYPLPSAPTSTWAGIETGMRIRDDAPQPPQVLEPAVPRSMRTADAGRSRRRVRPFLVAAAIVAVVAIASSVTLGLEMSRQNRRIDHLSALVRQDSMQQAADTAKTMPGAHQAVLKSATSGRAAHVVMLPDGSGYFMVSSLAELPPGRTYQLWAKIPEPSGARMVSVGVLGRSPEVVAFRAPGSVSEFDVTNEPGGGAQRPSANVAAGTIA